MVEVSFDIMKATRRRYQASVSGEKPMQLNNIEDAFDPKIQKGHADTKNTGLKWGHIWTAVYTALTGFFGFVGFNTQSTALRAFSFLGGLFTAGSAIFAGITTFTGKHPDVEEMETVLDKDRVVYSTKESAGKKAIKNSFKDYAMSNYLHNMLKEKIVDPIKAGKAEGTFLNLCGIKGVGKTYLSTCLAGEIANETGKEVEVWEINTDRLGSTTGDELSALKGLPFLGNIAGETRAQKLRRVIAHACLEVQLSKGSDGKPTKHIVLALDEIAKWLGAPEWGSSKSYNNADPAERSKICEELQKMIDKLKSEMGEGITLIFMSNASKKTIADTIQDRMTTHLFVNPDTEIRRDYYAKVLNSRLKEKNAPELSTEQLDEIAQIGKKSILDRAQGSYAYRQDKIEGYSDCDPAMDDKDTFLSNYNHLSFRDIEEIVKTVVSNASSSSTAKGLEDQLILRLTKAVDKNLADAKWKNEIAQQFNFELSEW